MRFLTLLLIAICLQACKILEEQPLREPSSENAPSDLIESCFAPTDFADAEYEAKVCLYQFKETQKHRNTNNAEHQDHLIYLLHGAQANAEFWVTEGRLKKLMEKWPRKVLKHSFASISIRRWNGQETNGAWSMFDQQVKPPTRQVVQVFNQIQNQLEQNLTISQKWKIKTRSILGQSMGGLNATLALVYGDPQVKYDKAAILCPQIYNFSPHSTEFELNEFLENERKLRNNQKIEAQLVRDYIFGFLKSQYPSKELWDQERLIQKFRQLAEKPRKVYISINTNDFLALYPGGQALAMQKDEDDESKLQLQPNVILEKNEQGGRNHCDHNYASLAEFLAR